MMEIAFYKGKNGRLFDRMICWKTRGAYSHCEALLDYDAATGRHYCASSSVMDGGVRFTWIQMDPTKWDIIKVPDINPVIVRAWFERHKGEPYDTLGLANFVFPVGDNRKGWFCNEALGDAIGLRDPQRFDPTGFSCILELMGGVWSQI